jgi:hypothetical protein
MIMLYHITNHKKDKTIFLLRTMIEDYDEFLQWTNLSQHKNYKINSYDSYDLKSYEPCASRTFENENSLIK